MPTRLTIASVDPDGFAAIDEGGVRIHVSSDATTLRLRVGQHVWAETDGARVSRVWVGPRVETPPSASTD